MNPFKNLTKSSLLEISSTAWPMAINAVLLQSVTIIDLLLIAALGDIPVAAYGIAGAIIAYVLGIQFSIANGTQLVLSRAVGAQDIQRIGMGVSSGMIMNIGFSVFIVIALFLGGDDLINAITHNDEVATQAISYVNISLYLLFFSSVSQVVVVYFNANKKTRIPLYGFLLEIPFNVVCSAVLIYGLWGAPKMGLAGAAWGSVFAIGIRFTYLAYRFNRERILGSVAGFRLLNKMVFKRHFNEVLPIVANFLVLLTGQTVMTGMFAQLSVSAFAAITLVLPWIKILSLFVNAWGQSSAIIVSQLIGKGDVKKIPPFVTQSHFVTLLISIVMVFGFYIFSKLLPTFYTNLSNETILALSIIAPAYIFIPIFRTNNMFCGNMVRAMGEGYLIVRINVVTLWFIALPACALLIYLGAPLVMIFGVILLDEIMKYYPFRKTLKARLEGYKVS